MSLNTAVKGAGASRPPRARSLGQEIGLASTNRDDPVNRGERILVLNSPKKQHVKRRQHGVMGGLEAKTSAELGVRERILDAAYELFARRGIRDVGTNEIVRRAKVTKATLYRHFHSKDDLVVAFLNLREQRWTLGWVEREARRRGDTPRDQLLAIFDLFDEWFHRQDFEACSFINVLLEMGAGHPAGRASIDHLANIRTVIRKLGDEAGLRDTDHFVQSWHILMKGSIVAATGGDTDAAKRAQAMAQRLIDRALVTCPRLIFRSADGPAAPEDRCTRVRGRTPGVVG